SLAPLTEKYLTGICASGLHEAKLGKEYYGGEVHVYSAAFNENDIKELLTFANHIVFNSCSQLLHFEKHCTQALLQRDDLQFGLRINPEHSEGDVALYDPCAKGSRLGVTEEELSKYLGREDFQRAFSLISGFHFHTLCEQGFTPLKRTLKVFEDKFSPYFSQLRWMNFGGGHHITAPGYQVDELIDCILRFRQQYELDVYLEPGEAIAIGCGVLVSEVLDITFNGLPQVILDTSATCHMPDTLEMPYRPEIMNAHLPEDSTYNYRLGGLTCLAGDVINDYSFENEVCIGDRLVFEDMAHYTMVKTSTFNGTKLPAIAIWNSETDVLNIVKEFTYDDFKGRLS
ncbi:MAG: carboxynorspermidine decarboxylase, partial [Pseudomonadales bacterium]|nr:carboxynorspermidine decarboxylase [Pseudomonadales bacterium]